MPYFPQPSNAQLVEFATFRVISSASTVRTVTANNGDFFVVDGTTSAATITLPPVAFGGPVGVKQVVATTGVATIVTADGSTLEDGPSDDSGSAGIPLVNINQCFVFASDGVGAWYVVGGVGAAPVLNS